MTNKQNIEKAIFESKKPLVMGILNLTPDSFYDGNRYLQEKNMLQRVENMLDEGADIIDIGAFSSRPGAEFVSYEEECKRLIPNLKSIVNHFPDAVLSIDTYRHQVAEEAISEGALIINDISGGNLDEKMFETIAKLQVPYIMMHMQGTPLDMQKNPVYTNLIGEIKEFFVQAINKLQALQFDKIIIDPGFGFGKTLSHNYQLLNELQAITDMNFPVLVGMSRKSMLYKLLESSPDKMLNATTVVNTIALQKAAKILRVHDVKEAVETVKIFDALRRLR